MIGSDLSSFNKLGDHEGRAVVRAPDIPVTTAHVGYGVQPVSRAPHPKGGKSLTRYPKTTS